ncbi:hypothetical protein C8Q78DRAFT_486889 [Trametes maxima]|nr:hypothetical protein C8Q78DRAFT_486889 [Trametes maxima]
MSVTPGKGRVSGIPTPGKPSAIPTPGLRPRSTSSAAHRPPGPAHEDEFISRAFADAIRANDPAQHRGPRASDASLASSISPSTSSASVSGARSLTASLARPPSAASSSSAYSLGQTRTPAASGRASARPPSRTSDVFARSASRAGRAFEVGDNVRIESLGFEGVLRYLGEIDGKPGMWAGVELSGGFAGKGKNNGSVAGIWQSNPLCALLTRPWSQDTLIIQRSCYPFDRQWPRNTFFRQWSSNSCRFHWTQDAQYTNSRRPPTTLGDRYTITSNPGRTTTSNIQANITPGSRASKYVGMTAKQLTSRIAPPASPARGAGSASPTRSTGFGSPVPPSRQLPSPTRSLAGSPFNTPKALGAKPSGIGIGMPSTTPSKSRPSLSNTPRPRIPSAIAMPPPASPSSTTLSSRSVSLNGPQTPLDGSALTDLEMNGKALQDRITGLLTTRAPGSPRPESRTSSGSTNPPESRNAELQSQNDRLNAQLAAAEDEIRHLRTRSEGAEREASQRIEALVAERDQHASRLSELEAAARTAERTMSERDSTIETLQRAAEQATKDVEKARTDGEARLRDVQSKLEDREALIAQLKEAVETREGEQSENAAVLKSSKHDLAVARDEITGLKHIVQELQKENAASAQRCKSLEAENKLLMSETEQLREDLKVLEEDVERSLAREEAILADENPSTPSTPSLDDIQALQRNYKDLKTKYETEVEQLRKKLADIEMKSARQVHDLNKEIGELESLIESKIYREDDLRKPTFPKTQCDVPHPPPPRYHLHSVLARRSVKFVNDPGTISSPAICSKRMLPRRASRAGRV